MREWCGGRHWACLLGAGVGLCVAPLTTPLASSVDLIPTRGNRQAARKEGWEGTEQTGHGGCFLVRCQVSPPPALTSRQVCTPSCDRFPGGHAANSSGKLACVWHRGSYCCFGPVGPLGDWGPSRKGDSFWFLASKYGLALHFSTLHPGPRSPQGLLTVSWPLAPGTQGSHLKMPFGLWLPYLSSSNSHIRL